MKRNLIHGLLVGLFAVSSFGVDAEVWGPEQLQEASDAAYGEFQKVLGKEAYATISGFSIQRKSQGNAADVKFTYGKTTPPSTKSFFCHVHGSAIDCH